MNEILKSKDIIPSYLLALSFAEWNNYKFLLIKIYNDLIVNSANNCMD